MSANPPVVPLMQVPGVVVSGTETVREPGLTDTKVLEVEVVQVTVWFCPAPEVQEEVFW